MSRSPIWKGKPGSHLVSERMIYDPDTGTSVRELVYQGTEKAAAATFGIYRGTSKSAEWEAEGGIGTTTVRIGTQVPGDIPTVVYEVATESLEKEIWTVPGVIAEARAFDAILTAVNDGYATYRSLAETAATERNAPAPDSGDYPLWRKVVNALKDGVTGWEVEYIVLRRMRRVERANLGSNRATLGSNQYIYSTAQLQVPNSVGFIIPDSALETPSNADYTWGWRRRPSNIRNDGQWVEQSSEFVYAEWANWIYDVANDFSGW